jgi:hypothetical protein
MRRRPPRGGPRGGQAVNDAAFTAISVAFFVVSGAFAYFCDKVR